MRRLLVLVGLALLALLARPVAAHQLGTRFDAPLPLPWLFAGAGATVALTALLLALRGPTPDGERTLFVVPGSVAAPLVALARVGFLVAVVAALWTGATGPQNAGTNFATLFVWPVWLKGVALLSVLAGSPWRVLSPWRTVYLALSRLEGRPLGRRPYPAWLGHWPAFVGFLLLVGVAENLTRVPSLPAATAVLVAGYALAMLAGGLLFGEPWFERADPLAVLYRLLGRAAPLAVRRETTPDAGIDGRPADADSLALAARVPWRDCTGPVADRALVAFVVAAVYTVSFDGFAESPEYAAAFFAVRETLGVGATVSVALYLAGLLGFLAAYWVVVRLVAWAAGTGRPAGVTTLGDGGNESPVSLARAVAPTLVPIAAGYEVAHNYGYVATFLGRLPVAAGGSGVDLLGWLPISAFWTSQVALVVLGHVVAVVAAHEVVAKAAPEGRALRAHAPLVALMVGYTVLSLWIVSRPLAG
jgi:hypothetical protein